MKHQVRNPSCHSVWPTGARDACSCQRSAVCLQHMKAALSAPCSQAQHTPRPARRPSPALYSVRLKSRSRPRRHPARSRRLHNGRSRVCRPHWPGRSLRQRRISSRRSRALRPGRTGSRQRPCPRCTCSHCSRGVRRSRTMLSMPTRRRPHRWPAASTSSGCSSSWAWCCSYPASSARCSRCAPGRAALPPAATGAPA